MNPSTESRVRIDRETLADLEVLSTRRGEPGIRFLRFEGESDDGVMRWSYRIQEGVSEQRLGMALLRQAGIPELLERIRDA